MAYTKTPVQDTHSHFRIPPIGNQSFTANTRTYQYQAGLRYVNCYPVIRENSTSPPNVFLRKVPKVLTKEWFFPNGGEPGLTDYDYDTDIFVFKTYFFRATAAGPSGPSITLLYDTTLYENTGYELLTIQRAADYSMSGHVIVIGICRRVSTQDLHTYSYNENTDTFTVSVAYLSGSITTYWDPGYANEVYVENYLTTLISRDLLIDGYHIVALKATRGGTNAVYISAPGDYNNFQLATDYFVPELDADDLVDIQKHHNYICAIGTKTIEFFYNAGIELGSPFVRQENYALRIGAAQNLTYYGGLVSISHGDDLYLFANTENGKNAIYLIRKFQATKLSDDYIEYILNTQTGLFKDIDPASVRLGMADVMGNVQLVLELRNSSTDVIEATFVFNEKDKTWWEWQESDSTGFIDTSYGIASNIAGKPFILDGGILGVDSNVQFSVVPQKTIPSYDYQDLLADITKTISIDASLLKPWNRITISAELTPP